MALRPSRSSAHASSVALLLTLLVTAPEPGRAREVLAGPPLDVSVTVYRNPERDRGSMDLDDLGGFALVTETRTVEIPAGTTRLRFEGVADGIDPATVLITGLPDGVIEKNRDAKVLSPGALVAETRGRPVEWVRTNPKTGVVTKERGTILSDASGVVFQSAAGIEALRCSGLPETFDFQSTLTTAATPTLSALVRSSQPLSVEVKLSYLATGFDWTASYVATVAPDGKSVDLGAWVTLANSNSVSFRNSHVQVVAGRLNRETEDVEPIAPSEKILALCWPRGSTSDTSPPPMALRARSNTRLIQAAPVAMAAALEDVAVAAAKRVIQENLGDLKLYRVPERTSLASRQSKQVRLLDRQHIPARSLYRADLTANESTDSMPTRKVLRTLNDIHHHLGLPLPAGQVTTFLAHEAAQLLVDESPIRDTALDEDVEIGMGESPDVRVTATEEKVTAGPSAVLPLVPGVVHVRSGELDAINRVDLSNARSEPVIVEVGLSWADGTRLVKATQAPTRRKGVSTFTLTVPANGKAALRYQTAHTEIGLEGER